MLTVWTKNIKDEEEKKRFQNKIFSSKEILDRQKEILKEIECEDLEKHETGIKVYDCPNWSYRQAHINGFKACLKIVDKLITLDPKETNDREHTRPSTTRLPAD